MSSVFRIIETFFFISLAITFLLVLLLVFHFKMRLLTLEEKHDTTLEIINNIVSELQYMKKSGINDPEIKKVNMTVEPIYDLNGGNGYITYVDDKKVFVSEGEESDGESDDESTVDESYDEGTEEGSDDSDEDSDEDGDEDAIEIKIVKLNSDVEVPILEVVVTKEGHDELSCVVEHIPDNYEGTDYYSDGDDDNIDIIEVGNANLIVYATHKPIETKIDDVTILDTEEPIIPDITESNLSNEDVDDIVQDSNVDDYRKLNVQSLKSIAISKGLSADPSKMNKKELLHLLA